VPDEPLEPDVPDEPLEPELPLEPEVPEIFAAKVVTIFEIVLSLISIVNDVLAPVVLAKILTLILELTDAKVY
jgi:hypothetical protein